MMFMALSFLACGNGTSTNIGNPLTPSEAVAKLTEAKSSLASGSISEARDVYTQIILRGIAGSESDTFVPKLSFVEVSVDEARVGRAICDILLLPETDIADTVLSKFGQGPWDVQATVFDDETGFLLLSWVDDEPQRDFFEFHDLPFANLQGCWGRAHRKCIISRTAAGYTIEDLAASMAELGEDSLQQIVTDLTFAYNNQTVRFSIPKELYNGDRDTDLNHADVTQLLSSAFATLAGIDFANSYRFDIDLSSLIDEQGEALVTKAGLVNLLNDQFALRADNRLASARTNLRYALAYSYTAIKEVLDGASGGVVEVNNVNRPLLEDLADGAINALNSFDTPIAFLGVLPEVTIDLGNFFSDPFDGDDIQALPFVLEDERIKAVEVYWQAAINTALGGCNIGGLGYMIFIAFFMLFLKESLTTTTKQFLQESLSRPTTVDLVEFASSRTTCIFRYARRNSFSLWIS